MKHILVKTCSDSRQRHCRGHILTKIFSRSSMSTPTPTPADVSGCSHPAMAFLSILVVLGITSICVYMISRTIQQYLKHSVSATFRLLHDTNPPFPTVIVCPINPINSLQNVQIQSKLNRTNYTGGDLFSSFFATLTTLNRSDLNTLTSWPLILVSCFFQKLSCKKATEFEQFSHPLYINCFRFNANATIHIGMTGEYNSLELKLYAGVPDLLSKGVNKYGFRILVSNSSTYPYNAFDSSVLATPDLGTFIEPRRYFYNQLPLPFSYCQVLGTYTQKTCFLFCLQTIVEQHCKCYSHSSVYNTLGKHRVCKNEEEIRCSKQVWFNYSDAANSFTAICLPLCPLECETSLLETNVAYFSNRYDLDDTYTVAANYSVQAELAELHGHNIQSYSNNIVQVSIYYPSLSYEQGNEFAAMTEIDLVSALGGHLGLFLGLSLLSVFHTIEAAAHFILIALRPTQVVDIK